MWWLSFIGVDELICFLAFPSTRVVQFVRRDQC